MLVRGYCDWWEKGLHPIECPQIGVVSEGFEWNNPGFAQRLHACRIQRQENAHLWMLSLSTGLYALESCQIFSLRESLVAGPGRLTSGLDMSCCDAERVILTPVEPPLSLSIGSRVTLLR